MPGCCYVFGCRSGYRGAPKAHIFRAPKDLTPEQKAEWLRNIPKRERPFDFEKSRICHLHFEPHCIYKLEKINPEQVTDGQRAQKWVLVSGAVPTKFINDKLPAYFNRKPSRPPPKPRGQPVLKKRKVTLPEHFESEPQKSRGQPVMKTQNVRLLQHLQPDQQKPRWQPVMRIQKVTPPAHLQSAPHTSRGQAVMNTQNVTLLQHLKPDQQKPKWQPVMRIQKVTPPAHLQSDPRKPRGLPVLKAQKVTLSEHLESDSMELPEHGESGTTESSEADQSDARELSKADPSDASELSDSDQSDTSELSGADRQEILAKFATATLPNDSWGMHKMKVDGRTARIIFFNFVERNSNIKQEKFIAIEPSGKIKAKSHGLDVSCYLPRVCKTVEELSDVIRRFDGLKPCGGVAGYQRVQCFPCSPEDGHTWHS